MELQKNHFNEIARLIAEARGRAEVAVNSQLVMLYWNVGRVIKENILSGEKPEYGKSVVKELAADLVAEYGRGYSQRNLFNMVKFYEAFNDEVILQTLSAKLPWSHVNRLSYIDDPLKRQFYVTMAINERWSFRVLTDRINSMLYERTLISKKPEETIANDLALLAESKIMSQDLVLRDPYVLDFLELKDSYSEKDLENAIIREIESFLLEFGMDFAFVGRQVRIIVNDKDFYIDLLFYHRKMRRLVAIDLKLGEFKPEYKAQMELYINWLAKNDMNEGDAQPIGIILVAEKDQEIIELLNLDDTEIHVAEYLTDAFKSKLPKAIANAQIMIDQRSDQN